MAFIQRDITVAVQIGSGQFGEEGFLDTVTLAGYRVSASIEVLGMPSLHRAQITVYGMSLSLMNRLAQVALLQDETRRNYVSVTAGDSKAGMSLAFSGGIINAWANFAGAPDVSFNISSLTAALHKVKPVAALSFPGPTDVAVIMAQLAKTMDLSFENNGVSVILANPYFPGSALDQMHAAAIAANIYAYVDADNHTLVILPKSGHRKASTDISVETGMVGYPQYQSPGAVSFRTLYNPAIRLSGLVNIATVNKPASGVWRVNKITHNLDSQTPNGEWFSDVTATNLPERLN